MAGAKIARQLDRPVTDAQQSADLVAHGLPHAAHFPVAPLVEHQSIGGVLRLAARGGLLDHPVEGRRTVFQRNAPQELADRVAVRPSPHPHQVFALDAARGMHQAMGEIAIGGEEEKTRGVDVQPADDDPATLLQRRQVVEDGGPALRVPPRGHLADRLVVQQDLARGRLRRAQLQLAPVEADLIARTGAIAELRDTPGHGQAAVGDPLLDLAARAQTGGREQLLEPYSHGQL